MDQGRRGNVDILGAVIGALCIVLLGMGVYWTKYSAAPNALADPGASERAKGNVITDKTTDMQRLTQP